MNLLFDYQKKIFVFLHDLKEKKIILIPSNLKSITVELPPKDHKADISCNASMVLAKINSSSPTTLAEILKKHLMESFKEFKSINIVKPGFLNISFQEYFWKKHLSEIVKLKSNYEKIIGIGETGLDYYYENSDKDTQKKIFIEHIEASLELNLPLIVHSRSAEDDTFNILKEW